MWWTVCHVMGLIKQALCFACRWWGLGCLDLNNVWPVLNSGCSRLILLFSRYGYWHTFFRYCTMIGKQKKWLQALKGKEWTKLNGQIHISGNAETARASSSFSVSTLTRFPHVSTIVSRFLKYKKRSILFDVKLFRNRYYFAYFTLVFSLVALWTYQARTRPAYI